MIPSGKERFDVHIPIPSGRAVRQRKTPHDRASPQARYALPVGMIGQAAYAAARRRTRDWWIDAERLAAEMRPAPDVRGIEHVPVSGPCVILPNHYERQGAVWVGWGAVAITAALAGMPEHREGQLPVRWVMTNTWADCYLGPVRVPPARLAWVLRCLASVYGVILMPALDLPKHEAERRESALALREIFHALSAADHQIVAFHPEAGGFETLIRPPQGMGRVLSALDRRGVHLVPTGVFEEDGRLTVQFGTPMPTGALAGLDDEAAADRVMREIAQLVPPAVRGAYADGGKPPVRVLPEAIPAAHRLAAQWRVAVAIVLLVPFLLLARHVGLL